LLTDLLPDCHVDFIGKFMMEKDGYALVSLSVTRMLEWDRGMTKITRDITIEVDTCLRMNDEV
jgi:hypothetical protein